MKNIFLSLVTIGLCITMMAEAQEFDKSLASAKASYNSGNLEDARFNLENALREIDAAIGREILKVLPTTLGGMNSDVKNDQVTGMSGGLVGGLYVHRVYGNTETKSATLDIISDSPLMAGINAILAMPMIMNSGDSNQKVVKVQGYKSLLTREYDENNLTTGYQVQTPFGNSMLTLDYNGNISEAEVLKLANSLPLERIIKLAQ
ncbi:MAG: hypothetical protein KF725_00855 [Cyclobacteriaceae bacterium]|nr:hypothetical protein [Cyclobacteriaceae bacterium]UYN86992.1 MAG: hypothetical protein KIT51_01550 [Cyclobacteriaceae bacterium]